MSRRKMPILPSSVIFPENICMRHESILVLGGSGFIGSHIVAQLAATERNIIVPTRRYERARHLLVLPTVRIVEADIFDEQALAGLMQKADAVINLVGVLHSRQGPAGSSWGPQFERAHVDLVRKIVRACHFAGVKRCLHISALGVAPDAPSMYLRSKAAGEKILLDATGLDVTIFRPSVVFGPEDQFLNLFAKMQRFLPLMVLGGAEAKFQPVFVDDIAQAILQTMEDPHASGKIYALTGPKIYTLRDLVKLAGSFSGHARPVIGLPPSLTRLQAWVLEHLPGEPLMSRDNVDSMKVDNIATAENLRLPGWHPTPLEAVAPLYLGKH